MNRRALAELHEACSERLATGPVGDFGSGLLTSKSIQALGSQKIGAALFVSRDSAVININKLTSIVIELANNNQADKFSIALDSLINLYTIHPWIGLSDDLEYCRPIHSTLNLLEQMLVRKDNLELLKTTREIKQSHKITEGTDLQSHVENCLRLAVKHNSPRCAKYLVEITDKWDNRAANQFSLRGFFIEAIKLKHENLAIAISYGLEEADLKDLLDELGSNPDAVRILRACEA